jgi:crossover junction endodeoxyribonuclease RuvC
MSRRILGIDPGVNGAACLFVTGVSCPIEFSSPGNHQPDGLITLPTVGEGKQREIDVLALRDWMLQMEPDEAIIEQVTAMPAIPNAHGVRVSMGATSSFNFGGTYRVLKALPMLFNIPTSIVTPGKWKGFYGLKGGADGKEQARQLALQRWPMLSQFLSRKKDTDRAEALLIADYKRRIDAGEVGMPRAPRKTKVPQITASMLEELVRPEADDIPE